eukprot:Sspe_Gene.89288::Locus_61076_Transcript_1_1_Confidence_1.000_Length_1490::g.89288::m.89288/K15537/AGMO; alkylglycerol monooxygenase
MEAAMEQLSNIRIIFYGVGPQEMARTKSIADVPDYFFAAIPHFFLLIAVEFVVGLYRAPKTNPIYRFNDGVASVLLGATQTILGYWFSWMSLAAYCFLYDNFHVVDLDHASWLGWVGCLCLVDCGYYWMHRHAHEFHILWSAHSVHHSGEDYNMATALRQGTLQAFFSWVWKLPNALFFHPYVFAHHEALNTLYQYWIHTTVIGSLGPLEYVLNTPSHHRMHHRPPGNCNYAGVLILWDRLFGTFAPETEQRDHYGLAKQYTTFDPIQANVEHLQRLNSSYPASVPRDLRFFLSLLCKKRVSHRYVIDPAGLFRPLPTPTQSLWVLPDRPKRVKFNGVDPTAHHRPLVIYQAFLALAGALPLSIMGLMRIPSLRSPVEVLAVQGGIIFMFASLGRCLDGFSTARVVNTVRVVCFAAAALLAPFPDDDPALRVFKFFSLADAVAWIAVFYLNC